MKKLIGLILLSASIAQADFNSALDAYEQGNFEAAYKEFYDLAALGEKRSQFNLGVMYYQGQFVERDLNQAYAWIKLSVEGETANEQQKNVLAIIEKEIDKSAAEKRYQKLVEAYGNQAILKRLYPVIRPDKKGPQAEPIKIVEPKFPAKAAMSRIEGYTRFKFDLDKNGKPRNIVLVDSFPPDVFDKESLRAVKKWEFKPAKDSNGVPIARNNLYYTIEFRLSGGEGDRFNAYVALNDPSIQWSEKVLPDIPKKQLREDKQVELNLNFDIESDGTVKNILVAETDKDVYVEELMDVIDQWKFKVSQEYQNISATVAFTHELIMSIRPKPEYLQKFKSAAQQGDAHGEYMYGFLLEKFPILEDEKQPNEWYFSSAIKGHAGAQYLLGKNLLLGKGCESDKEKGIEWLVRAAANGQLDAKQELGFIYAEQEDLKSHKAAKEFLIAAVDKDISERAKFRLAWLLIESPYDEVRDPGKALALADEINWKKIGDPISEYELKAAAFAATGNFKKALKYQEEALDEAEDGGFDTSLIATRLSSYQQRINR